MECDDLRASVRVGCCGASLYDNTIISVECDDLRSFGWTHLLLPGPSGEERPLCGRPWYTGLDAHFNFLPDHLGQSFTCWRRRCA